METLKPVCYENYKHLTLDIVEVVKYYVKKFVQFKSAVERNQI